MATAASLAIPTRFSDDASDAVAIEAPPEFHERLWRCAAFMTMLGHIGGSDFPPRFEGGKYIFTGKARNLNMARAEDFVRQELARVELHAHYEALMGATDPATQQVEAARVAMEKQRVVTKQYRPKRPTKRGWAGGPSSPSSPSSPTSPAKGGREPSPYLLLPQIVLKRVDAALRSTCRALPPKCAVLPNMASVERLTKDTWLVSASDQPACESAVLCLQNTLCFVLCQMTTRGEWEGFRNKEVARQLCEWAADHLVKADTAN
jgi:hypothetical protein